MRRRIFTIFLVVAVCVVPMFVTAYAEWGVPVDYTDLDYKVQYGEGFNTVTFPLPADNYVLKAWNTTQDLEVSNYGQSEIVFGAQSEYYDNFKIYIYPASTFGLSLSNIPVGAKIHMQVKIENLSEAGYTMPDWYLRYWYANDNTAQLLNGTDLMGERELSGIYNLDYVIQSVPGATRFVPSVLFNDFRPMADNAMYRIKLVSASIEMQVATEFWTQFQNQQNGEMLGKINDTLDNQWNADYEPSKPEGSTQVDNADMAESEVRENAQAGLDKGSEIQSNAGNILKTTNVVNGFACVTALFGLFADIPFFKDLLTISVALGVFALLMNLANSIASWHRGNVREAQREQRRQESAERYSRKHH